MKNLGLIVSLSLVLGMPGKAADPIYHDPGMKTIVQVAIVCRDIEACSKRWAALLGMDLPKITTTKPGREVNLVYRGKPSNGQVKLAFFETGQTVLELLQPVGGNTSWQEILDGNGEGVHHIAFKIQNVEKTLKACNALGMPNIHQGRFDSNDGTYIYLDSRKDLGVTIELLHEDKDDRH
ncbi:MAG TPA: VOC family protein [Terriglobia bacterium]|nr:VOC family protein [Terriglobia bacterium]